MEFNLQASSQDFSGLDQNWNDDDHTSAAASAIEGGLDSKSTDSLRLHSLNLNPDAQPFKSYENGNDLTIKITPSSRSTLTDTEYQRSSTYAKSDSFDSWYAGPNTTPISAASMPKYAQPYQQQQLQQLPPRGNDNSRYASYNNMISSLGQMDQPNLGGGAMGGGGGGMGGTPTYGGSNSFDAGQGGGGGVGGGLYCVGGGSRGVGPSPRMGSLSQDEYGNNNGGGYGSNGGVGSATSAGSGGSMAYGGRPMNRPNMGGGVGGGVGGGGVGGGMGSNKTSPSYGAAVAAAQMASPYGGGGGGGGGGGQYGMGPPPPSMNRYGGGGAGGGGGGGMRISPPSAAGGRGGGYGGGGMAPSYGTPAGGHHMGYGQQMPMGGGGHDSMQGTIFEVQFKAAFRYFVMDPMNPLDVNIGEFVIVEGDRGEDLGIVTQTMTMMAFIELKCQMNNSSLDEHENSVKRILRVASAYERQQLPSKYYDEQQVIEYCNELIAAKYQIPLIIVNAEYQFDRNKITLFYDATTRIDFRELVRDLYSTFKTRIWMKQVDDHKPFYPLQFATMSLATGAQFNP